MKHEKSCQFQCELCSGRYPSELKLRSHMDNVHVKVTCDLCGENYTRVELKKKINLKSRPENEQSMESLQRTVLVNQIGIA